MPPIPRTIHYLWHCDNCNTGLENNTGLTEQCPYCGHILCPDCTILGPAPKPPLLVKTPRLPQRNASRVEQRNITSGPGQSVTTPTWLGNTSTSPSNFTSTFPELPKEPALQDLHSGFEAFRHRLLASLNSSSSAPNPTQEQETEQEDHSNPSWLGRHNTEIDNEDSTQETSEHQEATSGWSSGRTIRPGADRLPRSTTKKPKKRKASVSDKKSTQNSRKEGLADQAASTSVSTSRRNASAGADNPTPQQPSTTGNRPALP